MAKDKVFLGGLTGLLCLAVGFGAGLNWPKAAQPAKDRIEISAEALGLQIFERASMLGRDLTEEEVENITARQTAYEIMIREAARLDIHLKDADIRKHMVALMQHVMSTSVREPTDAELTEHLKENRERYMTPRRITFEHVFFEGGASEADAWYQTTLSHGEIPTDVGDIFWLGRRMEKYSASQLLTVLGNKFVKQLMDLPLNEWSKPIQSARGVHLVRVEEVHEPEALPAKEMQSRLREDWKKNKEFAVFKDQISEFAQGYDIILPDETAANTVASRHATQAGKVWKAKAAVSLD